MLESFLADKEIGKILPESARDIIDHCKSLVTDFEDYIYKTLTSEL